MSFEAAYVSVTVGFSPVTPGNSIVTTGIATGAAEETGVSLGFVDALMAMLTQTLAGRDKLIGDVIKNLSKTLDIVGSRDAELSTTISTLRDFIGGLKDDREDILDSLDGISDLTDETAGLLAPAPGWT